MHVLKSKNRFKWLSDTEGHPSAPKQAWSNEPTVSNDPKRIVAQRTTTQVANRALRSLFPIGGAGQHQNENEGEGRYYGEHQYYPRTAARAMDSVVGQQQPSPNPVALAFQDQYDVVDVSKVSTIHQPRSSTASPAAVSFSSVSDPQQQHPGHRSGIFVSSFPDLCRHIEGLWEELQFSKPLSFIFRKLFLFKDTPLGRHKINLHLEQLFRERSLVLASCQHIQQRERLMDQLKQQALKYRQWAQHAGVNASQGTVATRTSIAASSITLLTREVQELLDEYRSATVGAVTSVHHWTYFVNASGSELVEECYSVVSSTQSSAHQNINSEEERIQFLDLLEAMTAQSSSQSAAHHGRKKKREEQSEGNNPSFYHNIREPFRWRGGIFLQHLLHDLYQDVFKREPIQFLLGIQTDWNPLALPGAAWLVVDNQQSCSSRGGSVLVGHRSKKSSRSYPGEGGTGSRPSAWGMISRDASPANNHATMQEEVGGQKSSTIQQHKNHRVTRPVLSVFGRSDGIPLRKPVNIPVYHNATQQKVAREIEDAQFLFVDKVGTFSKTGSHNATSSQLQNTVAAGASRIFSSAAKICQPNGPDIDALPVDIATHLKSCLHALVVIKEHFELKVLPLIQARWRGMIVRRKMLDLIESSIMIQKTLRMFLVKKEIGTLKRQLAVKIIHPIANGFLDRKWMYQLRHGIVLVQALYRGGQTRQRLTLQQQACLFIQSWYRDFLEKRHRIKKSRLLRLIRIQRIARAFLSRLRCGKLRVEKRSHARRHEIRMALLHLVLKHEPHHREAEIESRWEMEFYDFFIFPLQIYRFEEEYVLFNRNEVLAEEGRERRWLNAKCREQMPVVLQPLLPQSSGVNPQQVVELEQVSSAPTGASIPMATNSQKEQGEATSAELDVPSTLLSPVLPTAALQEGDSITSAAMMSEDGRKVGPPQQEVKIHSTPPSASSSTSIPPAQEEAKQEDHANTPLTLDSPSSVSILPTAPPAVAATTNGTSSMQPAQQTPQEKSQVMVTMTFPQRAALIVAEEFTSRADIYVQEMNFWSEELRPGMEEQWRQQQPEIPSNAPPEQKPPDADVEKCIQGEKEPADKKPPDADVVEKKENGEELSEKYLRHHSSATAVPSSFVDNEQFRVMTGTFLVEQSITSSVEWHLRTQQIEQPETEERLSLLEEEEKETKAESREKTANPPPQPKSQVRVVVNSEQQKEEPKVASSVHVEQQHKANKELEAERRRDSPQDTNSGERKESKKKEEPDQQLLDTTTKKKKAVEEREAVVSQTEKELLEKLVKQKQKRKVQQDQSVTEMDIWKRIQARRRKIEEKEKEKEKQPKGKRRVSWYDETMDSANQASKEEEIAQRKTAHNGTTTIHEGDSKNARQTSSSSPSSPPMHSPTKKKKKTQAQFYMSVWLNFAEAIIRFSRTRTAMIGRGHGIMEAPVLAQVVSPVEGELQKGGPPTAIVVPARSGDEDVVESGSHAIPLSAPVQRVGYEASSHGQQAATTTNGVIVPSQSTAPLSAPPHRTPPPSTTFGGGPIMTDHQDFSTFPPFVQRALTNHVLRIQSAGRGKWARQNFLATAHEVFSQKRQVYWTEEQDFMGNVLEPFCRGVVERTGEHYYFPKQETTGATTTTSPSTSSNSSAKTQHQQTKSTSWHASMQRRLQYFQMIMTMKAQQLQRTEHQRLRKLSTTLILRPAIKTFLRNRKTVLKKRNETQAALNLTEKEYGNGYEKISLEFQQSLSNLQSRCFSYDSVVAKVKKLQQLGRRYLFIKNKFQSSLQRNVLWIEQREHLERLQESILRRKLEFQFLNKMKSFFRFFIQNGQNKKDLVVNYRIFQLASSIIQKAMMKGLIQQAASSRIQHWYRGQVAQEQALLQGYENKKQQQNLQKMQPSPSRNDQPQKTEKNAVFVSLSEMPASTPQRIKRHKCIEILQRFFRRCKASKERKRKQQEKLARRQKQISIEAATTILMYFRRYKEIKGKYDPVTHQKIAPKKDKSVVLQCAVRKWLSKIRAGRISADRNKLRKTEQKIWAVKTIQAAFRDWKRKRCVQSQIAVKRRALLAFIIGGGSSSSSISGVGEDGQKLCPAHKAFLKWRKQGGASATTSSQEPKNVVGNEKNVLLRQKRKTEGGRGDDDDVLNPTMQPKFQSEFRQKLLHSLHHGDKTAMKFTPRGHNVSSYPKEEAAAVLIQSIARFFLDRRLAKKLRQEKRFVKKVNCQSEAASVIVKYAKRYLELSRRNRLEKRNEKSGEKSWRVGSSSKEEASTIKNVQKLNPPESSAMNISDDDDEINGERTAAHLEGIAATWGERNEKEVHDGKEAKKKSEVQSSPPVSSKIQKTFATLRLIQKPMSLLSPPGKKEKKKEGIEQRQEMGEGIRSSSSSTSEDTTRREKIQDEEKNEDEEYFLDNENDVDDAQAALEGIVSPAAAVVMGSGRKIQTATTVPAPSHYNEGDRNSKNNNIVPKSEEKRKEEKATTSATDTENIGVVYAAPHRHNDEAMYSSIRRRPLSDIQVVLPSSSITNATLEGELQATTQTSSWSGPNDNEGELSTANKNDNSNVVPKRVQFRLAKTEQNSKVFGEDSVDPVLQNQNYQQERGGENRNDEEISVSGKAKEREIGEKEAEFLRHQQELESAQRVAMEGPSIYARVVEPRKPSINNPVASATSSKREPSIVAMDVHTTSAANGASSTEAAEQKIVGFVAVEKQQNDEKDNNGNGDEVTIVEENNEDRQEEEQKKDGEKEEQAQQLHEENMNLSAQQVWTGPRIRSSKKSSSAIVVFPTPPLGGILSTGLKGILLLDGSVLPRSQEVKRNGSSLPQQEGSSFIEDSGSLQPPPLEMPKPVPSDTLTNLKVWEAEAQLILKKTSSGVASRTASVSTTSFSTAGPPSTKSLSQSVFPSSTLPTQDSTGNHRSGSNFFDPINTSSAAVDSSLTIYGTGGGRTTSSLQVPLSVLLQQEEKNNSSVTLPGDAKPDYSTTSAIVAAYESGQLSVVDAKYYLQQKKKQIERQNNNSNNTTEVSNFSSLSGDTDVPCTREDYYRLLREHRSKLREKLNNWSSSPTTVTSPPKQQNASALSVGATRIPQNLQSSNTIGAFSDGTAGHEEQAAARRNNSRAKMGVNRQSSPGVVDVVNSQGILSHYPSEPGASMWISPQTTAAMKTNFSSSPGILSMYPGSSQGGGVSPHHLHPQQSSGISFSAAQLGPTSVLPSPAVALATPKRLPQIYVEAPSTPRVPAGIHCSRLSLSPSHQQHSMISPFRGGMTSSPLTSQSTNVMMGRNVPAAGGGGNQKDIRNTNNHVIISPKRSRSAQPEMHYLTPNYVPGK